MSYKQSIKKAKKHAMKAAYYSFQKFDKAKRQYHLAKMTQIMTKYHISNIDTI